MAEKREKLNSWILFYNHHDNGAMDSRLKCVTFESNQCTEEHNVHVYKNIVHLKFYLFCT